MSLIEKALISSTAHGSPGARDDWETPAWIFSELDREFSFTLDAAATRLTRKVERFIGPEEDGLKTPWGGPGSRVWLNPPYGRAVKHWVRRAYEQSREGAVVVVLVFSRTDTSWWHEYAMKASEIRFVRGRLRFLQDGEEKDPSPAPSCLLVFTPWSSGPPKIRAMEKPKE